LSVEGWGHKGWAKTIEGSGQGFDVEYLRLEVYGSGFELSDSRVTTNNTPLSIYRFLRYALWSPAFCTGTHFLVAISEENAPPAAAR